MTLETINNEEIFIYHRLNGIDFARLANPELIPDDISEFAKEQMRKNYYRIIPKEKVYKYSEGTLLFSECIPLTNEGLLLLHQFNLG